MSSKLKKSFAHIDFRVSSLHSVAECISGSGTKITLQMALKSLIEHECKNLFYIDNYITNTYDNLLNLEMRRYRYSKSQLIHETLRE